jgi:hypothetical protein
MKKRILLVVAVAIIATGWLVNKIMRDIGLRDTGDITVGMTFAEYIDKVPADEHLDFCNYSYFVNNHGFPVLVRCVDDTIVQMQVIDLSKTRATQERFEKITAGMTLSEVSGQVGTPMGIALADDMTLIYNCQNKYMYMIRYTLTDHILYVESVTCRDME